ncbi:hypothetical protein Tco_0487577 [Tanacetum coccineum]
MTAQRFKCKVHEVQSSFYKSGDEHAVVIVSDEEIDKQNLKQQLQLHGKDSGCLTEESSSTSPPLEQKDDSPIVIPDSSNMMLLNDNQVHLRKPERQRLLPESGGLTHGSSSRREAREGHATVSERLLRSTQEGDTMKTRSEARRWLGQLGSGVRGGGREFGGGKGHVQSSMRVYSTIGWCDSPLKAGGIISQA